ncbi:MAG: hypothetical protein SZ59_C0002G0212 [candidate division TM6 bacterium GW2011_GWF2_28_16]|nr:MAG: hypothetical protein SZ59_C0002G0212 [candidate division TM6 bacterium GW2011_GWF2_28_16]
MKKQNLIFYILLIFFLRAFTYDVQICKTEDQELTNYYEKYPSKKILAEAERIVAELETSYYSYDTIINTKQEKYFVDCSSCLSHVLGMAAYPWYEKIFAYAVMTRYPQRKNNPPIQRALAKDYANFFMNHDSSLDIFKGWEVITYLEDLEPGDVIAIKYEDGATNTGHVLILAGKPMERSPYSGTGGTDTPAGFNEWLVRIIDSSSSPHGTSSGVSAQYYPRVPDTRTGNSKNIDEGGVGAGYMILVTKGNTVGVKHRIHGWRRSNLSSSTLYRNDNSDIPSGTIRPIRFGRAIAFDSNPRYYSDYYGVNVEPISIYKDMNSFVGTGDESGDGGTDS